MKSYHPYVFDHRRRKLVGQFEEMYQAEDQAGFDSWHERDLRMLRKRLSREILSAYNFGRVLEIGCGKGSFTQWLKKENNRVLAVDISPTAVRKARETFPDIDFRVMDATQIAALCGRFDVVVIMAALAYIQPWRPLLEALAAKTRYLYIAEYVPRKPIGCVKSGRQLLAAVQRHYVIEHHLVLDGEHHLVMARSSKKSSI
jgi:2-polyprenyl-3-methyl-5-hydroxy-6-metoxy-1,4-benzoquinol methylase